MRLNAPLPEPDWRRWRAHAPTLVRLLRTARLTLLYGAAGCGKTALLNGEVLPLLRRRASDQPEHLRPSGRVVVPFSERRGRSNGLLAEHGFEISIGFDDWGDAPLPRLEARIDEALRGLSIPVQEDAPLVDRMATLCEQRGARFLIVLDGFERHLAMPPERADIRDFDDALVDAASRPFLPVHVLIALRGEAAPLLARYRQRIARFDDHFVDLGDQRRVAVPSPLLWLGAGPVADPGIEEIVLPPWTDAPLITDAVDAAVPEAMQVRFAPPRPRIDAVPELTETATPRLPAARPTNPAPARASVPLPRRPFKAWMGLAAAAVLVFAGLLAWLQADRSNLPELSAGDPTSRTPATSPPETVTAPGGPSARVALPVPVPMDLTLDESNPGDRRMAEDLARVVAPGAGLKLNLQLAASSGAAPLDATAQGLAIAHYDALQALRQRAPKAPTRLLLPLRIDEVSFVVRADSPLRTIDQIKGRRLDVGAPQTGRAFTATAIYQRMFGRPPLTSAEADATASMRRLVEDKSVDVVVTVGPLPPAWNDRLHASGGDGIRLLALDRNAAASRKALQAYLPVTVDGAPTLGVMSFLVTRSAQDARSDQRLADLAASLCRSLPELRSRGDAVWASVRPDLAPEVGWPYVPQARAALQDCAR